MDALILYFLPALLLLGIITSYDDIKNATIRNKWVLCAIVYGVLMHLALFLFGNDLVTEEYLKLYAINAAFSLFVGIFLWVSSLWSAGDAKLFFGFAMLMPLSIYKLNAVSHFPSFAILINTFIPFLIFYIGKIIWKSSSKLKKEIAAMMLRPSFILENVFFVFAFSWLSSKAALFLGIFAPVFKNLFVLILLLFLLNYMFERWFSISTLYLGSAISAIALLIDSKLIFTTTFAYNFALLLFFFVFIRYFVLHLAYEVFSYPVFIENLKPGMLVAENFVSKHDSFMKKTMLPLGFLNALSQRSEGTFLFALTTGGITLPEIEKLQQLHSNGTIAEHTVRVFQTVPFAPFLFMGVILTILIHGSILLI